MSSFSLAMAQDSKVTTGAIAFGEGQGSYEKARGLLEEGVSDPSALKAKNVPKAYFMLGEIYVFFAQIQNPDHPDAAEKAYDYYKKAIAADDVKKKYTKKLVNKDAVDKYWSALYNAGVNAYNYGAYEKAQDLFSNAIELDEKHITSLIMLGYSNLLSKDTANAIKYISKGIDTYMANKPETPDTLVSNAYTQKALLLMHTGDIRAALDAAASGSKEFSFNEDLPRVELSIYAGNPDLFSEAQAKFESAIAADPDDIEVKLAYADLLSRNEKSEEALKLYKDIYDKDSTNYYANVNLAVHYINTAAKSSEKMMAEDDEDKISTFEKELIENLRSAYPYMLEAHEQKPENLEWVNRLVQISTYVPEFFGDIERWTTLQKELVAKNKEKAGGN